jgi:Fe(3+) dicitrate transport protein
VSDDGAARHSGIVVRGSPARRSRKVLVMEDGDSINFSSYIDPSTHYTPPIDRIEAVEVLRGTVVTHGPLNNHGVVNFVNLSPFGTPETVVSASLGHTEGSDEDLNIRRHIHHRQQFDHVGVVLSYTGEEVSGAWDNERLRYNDFYGALGWKGIDQDLVFSAVYFRQRDRYDEDNFEGSEADFFANGRDKSFVGGADFNNYNDEFFRLQLAHNWYVDDDTTVSSRIYFSEHDRPRFASRDDGPQAVGGYMRGRERLYNHFGVESRVEFADRPFIMGMSQDIQIGARYERHSLRNCNSVGELNEVLKFSNRGDCFADEDADPPEDALEDGQLEKYESDAFSAFAQTAVKVARDVTVTPGVRFEHYDVSRDTIFNEGEPLPPFERSRHDHVLPGVALSWTGIERTNVYAGYHRGITPHVARGEFFPLPEEIGDNFQVGVRSTAIRGLTFDLAYFHSRIDDYQIKEAFTDDLGNNVFGSVDEVEINGFEAYGRLDSQPFHGGPWNFYGEAVYTFADSVIEEGVNVSEDGLVVTDVSGNLLPEVPRHYANLTLGLAHQVGWDASVTWTYRGEFFTDVQNTAFGGDPDGINGEVPDVWLLSARANYTLPDTATTVFVSGTNLEDKFYITDRSDGMKPGQGRTLWTGFKHKF